MVHVPVVTGAILLVFSTLGFGMFATLSMLRIHQGNFESGAKLLMSHLGNSIYTACLPHK